MFKLNPGGNFVNISNYKNEIKSSWTEMINEKVFSSQYGLN